MMNILVLCTGNSCRSQMVQGYLEFFAKDKARIYSAGVEIHGVNPDVLYYMLEDGIDISHYTSNHVLEYQSITFDFVITVCDHAKEVCPIFPSTAKMIHHNFEDPSKTSGTKKEIEASFRKIRNEIKEFSKQFAEEYIL